MSPVVRGVIAAVDKLPAQRSANQSRDRYWTTHASPDVRSVKAAASTGTRICRWLRADGPVGLDRAELVVSMALQLVRRSRLVLNANHPCLAKRYFRSRAELARETIFSLV